MGHGSMADSKGDVQKASDEHLSTQIAGSAAVAFDSHHDNAPVDRWCLLEVIFVLQGIGMLLPWNAFLTITNYWSYKMVGSPFFGNYMNYFTFVSTTVQTIASIIVARLLHRIEVRTRVLLPLAFTLLAFVLCLAFVWIESFSGTPFFVVTIVFVALLSVSMGLQQTGVYSVSSYFPDVYTQRALQGAAWGGVVISSINVFTILGSPGTQEAASAFFAVSIAFLSICVVSFIYLIKSPVFHHYYAAASHNNANTSNSEVVPAAIEGEKTITETGSQGSDSSSDEREVTTEHFMHVFKKTFVLNFSVFLGMFVTLAIFPVVPVSIQPTTSAEVSRFFGDLWIPVYVFLFYSLTDTIGRYAGSYMRIPCKLVPLFSVARFVFFPLFLMCNGMCYDAATQSMVPSKPPAVFMNDAFPVLFIILLGLTNGMCFEAVFYYAPNMVTGHDKALVNSIAASFAVCGLMTGSFVSFGVKAINCPGNPFAS
eukprot:comp12873_c0_seq1/m.8053 comp12873_c0_seq1/g.8053  ORF comp12873_c0_seq1/g.8053 comp12873_c0_seq1/m.8053 type:complete len:482 (-) comp12873_c0_seq1:301-1746(-)